MAIRLKLVFLVLLMLASAAMTDTMKVRLGEVARLGDGRSNQLLGYGLVVGLQGTGDSTSAAFTFQSVASMLRRLGLVADLPDIKSKNVAAVMVVAELSGFARVGDRIDCLISSLGDAKSLRGGVLLQTPLMAADGQLYAVAQGPVSIGGFTASGKGGSSTTQNHQTTAALQGGGMVERALPMPPSRGHVLQISFARESYEMVNAAAAVISEALAGFPELRIHPRDAATLEVDIPACFWGREAEFISRLSDLEIEYYRPARVVVNERTGTVIIGGDVRVMPVAVSIGSLTVEVKQKLKVHQPPPFTNGATVVVPDETLDVDEGGPAVLRAIEGASVSELVKALNAIGATTGELITILQTIYESGALTADLVVM